MMFGCLPSLIEIDSTEENEDEQGKQAVTICDQSQQNAATGNKKNRKTIEFKHGWAHRMVHKLVSNSG